MSGFNLAVVGAGGISRAHIAAAQASDRGIGVSAVVDPIESARKSAADAADAKPFASLDAFLASPHSRNVEAAVICTPPSARLSVVEALLTRRIAVLMEKPMAHTLSDAQVLADLAAAHQEILTSVGYCHRFTPAISEMKNRIAAGEIGAITRFENTFAAPLPRMQTHWMSDPAISGGGSFIDTGCHSLDLFLHLIGPGKLQSAVFAHAWPGRGESSATALLESEDGVAGVIQSGWTEPARFVITVVGTKGSLTYDYDVASELRFRPNDGPEQKIAVETHEIRFQRQLESFAAAVRGENPAIVAASFADALLTARWVDEAQQLAAS